MFAIIYKYESAAGEAIPMHKIVQNSRSIKSSEVLIVRFGFYGAAWNSIRPRTDLCIKLLFNDFVVQQPCMVFVFQSFFIFRFLAKGNSGLREHRFRYWGVGLCLEAV